MAHEPVLDPSGLARAAERLATLIPGYSGYKERERLREEDRAVREAVVRSLGITVGRLERALSGCIRALPGKDVESADRILRTLNRTRDRIRFAPTGYASLFARKQIGAHELEGILALDAQLWGALEELDRLAAEWDAGVRSGDTSWPGDALTHVMTEFEDTVDERESLVRS